MDRRQIAFAGARVKNSRNPGAWRSLARVQSNYCVRKSDVISELEATQRNIGHGGRRTKETGTSPSSSRVTALESLGCAPGEPDGVAGIGRPNCLATARSDPPARQIKREPNKNGRDEARGRRRRRGSFAKIYTARSRRAISVPGNGPARWRRAGRHRAECSLSRWRRVSSSGPCGFAAFGARSKRLVACLGAEEENGTHPTGTLANSVGSRALARDVEGRALRAFALQWRFLSLARGLL